jgi:TolB-like protein/class 3 adenylate cyclase
MSVAKDRRRLAAIMFTDMVGYSALCQRDERLANQLLEDHRRMVRAALTATGGREVDTTGDGFLLEYQSAQQAVHCAILLQQRQAERNASVAEARRFQFRVGIHLGEIETRERNIIGDGVNIAARLEPLSPKGGLAISAAVHTLVRNRLSADFRSIGAPELKNIAEPIEVFVLDQEQTATVHLPEPEPRRTGAGSVQPSRRLGIAALVAVGLLGVVAALTVLLTKHTPAPELVDKSVAVLPFSNFSSDKENEYFAAGIHDSLLTHLARVKDLKVISRTSVMQYKDGARNLRDIGTALGVANIVEGSVQKTGNRVRVQAQLIEAATDRHLWAESYDRDLADVFAIQSEVAQQVVAAVRATLTSQEKGRIEQHPTTNAEAYDLYLKSEALARQPSVDHETQFRMQTLLEQAVALDPGFALAHARLSRVHTTLYWFGIDTTARRRDLAKAAAETALRLQPDLAEGHLAMGMYFYQGFRDYERAMQEFSEALNRAPNSAEIVAYIGFVQRRRGQWDGSIASLGRAIELDPRDPSMLTDLAQTYLALRQYGKAVALYEKAAALAPEDIGAKLMPEIIKGFVWKGDLEPLKKALAGIPPGVDPGQNVSIARIQIARNEGRYADVISLLAAFPRDGLLLGASNMEVPKDFFAGQAYMALDDSSKARPHFVRARDWLREYIAREPESVNLPAAQAWLGLTQAYLGERAEALGNAHRALELLPISRDTLDGPGIAVIVAAIHMRLGDHDRALTELEPLLKVPAGMHAYPLQRNLDWKPLWDDPRFKKLVADNLPRG